MCDEQHDTFLKYENARKAKLAKILQRKCKKRGISIEVIYTLCYARAVRRAGIERLKNTTHGKEHTK